MHADTTSPENSIAVTRRLAGRSARALAEKVAAFPLRGAVFSLPTESGTEHHVDGSPRLITADGGTVAADDALDGDGTDAADRPADCECWAADAELPCFACFLEGYDGPNPAPPAADGEGRGDRSR